MTGYPSELTAAQRERIRQWHESGYAALQAEAAGGDQTFAYLGRSIVVPPGVQPVTGMSHLLGEAVLAEVRPADRVLDLGTGSGVNAVLAAGTARAVLAVDINPYAVAAARANAARNGVADRVTVRHSDVFGSVDGRFDLIIFDPPFRWFRPRDWQEAAVTNENYRALTEFFCSARVHLAPGGRMLVFFGSSGDLGYLRRLIDEQGFRSETVAQAELTRDGQQIEYLTYRLSG